MIHRTFMSRPALCLALLLAAAGPALAEPTTQDDVLAVQVLPGWALDQGRQMAALQLDLAPGWKTYWRSPGEAGIPPQFDWSGSTNLKAVILNWPTPQVFDTNGMRTIGYHDRLILPVELIPEDPTRPITLNAKMDLGICRDICMPASVEMRADLGLPPKGGAHDPRIEAALKARPLSGREAGVGRVSCQVEPIKDGLRLVANITLPPRGGAETVAFETPNPAIWVAEAQTERKGDTLISMTELVPPDGRPFALDRSGLRVTVISDRGAVEINGCPGG